MSMRGHSSTPVASTPDWKSSSWPLPRWGATQPPHDLEGGCLLVGASLDVGEGQVGIEAGDRLRLAGVVIRRRAVVVDPFRDARGDHPWPDIPSPASTRGRVRRVVPVELVLLAFGEERSTDLLDGDTQRSFEHDRIQEVPSKDTDELRFLGAEHRASLPRCGRRRHDEWRAAVGAVVLAEPPGGADVVFETGAANGRE